MRASERSHLIRLMDEEVHYRADLRDRLAEGDLHTYASIPLPPSQVLACSILLPPSPTSACELPLSAPNSPVSVNMFDNEDTASRDDEVDDSASVQMQPNADDDVSVIGSDDDSSDSVLSGSGGAAGSNTYDEAAEAQLDLMLRFEDFMNDIGDLRDPVVDVWYDLDMVTEVTDPLLFIEARHQIRKCVHSFFAEKRPLTKARRRIIDEAEIRLGIREDPSLSESQPSLARQSSSHEKNE